MIPTDSGQVQCLPEVRLKRLKGHLKPTNPIKNADIIGIFNTKNLKN
jgi:hypothetical protein